MDEFQLELYYREQDRRLHDEPYYGDSESEILDEQRKDSKDAVDDDDDVDTMPDYF